MTTNHQSKAREIVETWMQDPREIALLAPGTDIDPLVSAIAEALGEETEMCARYCDSVANAQLPPSRHEGIEKVFADVGEDAGRNYARKLAEFIRSRLKEDNGNG